MTNEKWKNRQALAVVACSLITLAALGQVRGCVALTPLQQYTKRLPDRLQSSAVHKNEIQVDVVLGLVNVTVTEPTSRPVAGLEKDNFRIYQDGIEQEIVNVSSEDVPATIGLIFDMSGSMTDKVDRERQASQSS